MQPDPPFHTLTRRYVQAQLAGDRREALRLIVDEALGAGMPVSDVHLGVIQPAQYEIGRLWQDNRISVAQEHLATSISQLVISHLYQAMPRDPSNGRTVVVACVEGEHHDVGARVGADFLEMAGFGVRYLGPNVPSESLAAMIAGQCPDLLALSVTMSFNIPALREAVERVRRACPKSVPLVAGGHAFRWESKLADELGVAGFGTDARALVAQARKLTGVRS